jgi:RNA polymerase sigma-70 factor (ECF subfamily)
MVAFAFMAVAAATAEGVLRLDAQTFRSFYDDALPRIYGYFLHRCGGVATVAEDLTQETFLAAVAELKKDTRVTAPMAWIYGIARHKLLDYYRRQERIERPLAAANDPDLLEDEVATDDPDAAHEQAVAALASVAASQRAALVLCYVDGYSVAEAACLLGKSVEAVESLLARGRQSFKRAYLVETT